MINEELLLERVKKLKKWFFEEIKNKNPEYLAELHYLINQVASIICINYHLSLVDELDEKNSFIPYLKTLPKEIADQAISILKNQELKDELTAFHKSEGESK